MDKKAGTQRQLVPIYSSWTQRSLKHLEKKIKLIWKIKDDKSVSKPDAQSVNDAYFDDDADAWYGGLLHVEWWMSVSM